MVSEDDFLPWHVKIAVGGESKKTLESIKWTGQGGKLHYPTEHEFLRMVNETIYFHYNMTMPEEKVVQFQRESYQR